MRHAIGMMPTVGGLIGLSITQSRLATCLRLIAVERMSVECAPPTTFQLQLVVLMVQWLSVGLVIERSLVRLPAEALSAYQVN